MAAGFLKSAALHAGLQKHFEINILDIRQGASGGCVRIIREILLRKPDIVGTSIYLWNAERNSYIFGEVKRQLKKLRVVVGGPEVTRDSDYILEDPAYDFFVFGEGEYTWVELLRHLHSSKAQFGDIRGMAFRDGPDVVINPLHNPVVDINQVPSPYLEHILNPADFGEMLMFTMRGCLQGCSYCSWSARGKLRAFSPDRLHKELLLAHEVAEKSGRRMVVSIADSAFNTSPVFWDFCRSAKEINHDGLLDIRCFLQAELVDDEVANALKDAGVATAEVGLQSVNPAVLSNINRFDNIERFIEGVQVLKNWGFPIVVDTILGLPDDNRNSFKKTLSFTHDQDLQPVIFNLSLGHGSKLRSKANEFGIRSDEHPPYYVCETNSLTQDEIRGLMRENVDILADAEQLSDLQFPVSTTWISQMPSASSEQRKNDLSPSMPVTHIDIPASGFGDNSPESELLSTIVDELAINLTIRINLEGRSDEIDLAWLESLIRNGLEKNPFSNWRVIFEGGSGDTRRAAVEFVLKRIPRQTSFLTHRDFLFPKDIPIVRSCSFAVYSIEPLGESDLAPTAHCLPSVLLHTLPNSTLLAAMEGAKGMGLIIDTTLPLKGANEINAFLTRLEPLHAKGKVLYFKDWVLQRFWQQNYLKTSPRIIHRHEVTLDNGELHHLELGEEDLYLDAILRCGLTTSPDYREATYKSIIEAAVRHALDKSKRM